MGDTQVTIWCVVPHSSTSAVLVNSGAGTSLPAITLRAPRSEYLWECVEQIRDEFLARSGIDATVLRHLINDGPRQAFVLEPQYIPGLLPDRYIWQEPAEWSDPISTRAWSIWRADVGSLAPWEVPGWYARAAEWVRERLTEAGYSLLGDVVQVKGAWGWSSILRSTTDRGDVYFKAPYSRPPDEAVTIERLRRHAPANLPELIAVDEMRNWMLMPDFGGNPLARADVDGCCLAVSTFARLQRSTESEIDEWRSLGVVDLSPARLDDCLDDLLHYDSVNILADEDRYHIDFKRGKIASILSRLSTSPISTVLCNEDFRTGNIVLREGGPVFFDWSTLALTHPFFGLNYFLNRIPKRPDTDRTLWGKDLVEADRRRIASAYLSVWADITDWSRIVEDFWLCRRLFGLYEAIRCNADLAHTGTESIWGRNNQEYIPRALRQMLADIDHEPIDLLLDPYK